MLILKLIQKEKIVEQDIYNELHEICDREHSSCNSDCPVYLVNQDEIPLNKETNKCICFKNGIKMYNFILNR